MKEITVSAAIILNSNNEVLITQRGYGNNKGKWEFPGGKIEEGETPEKTLIREIKEELDANIIIERKLGVITYTYDDFVLHMHNFVCHFTNDHYQLLEHMDGKFVSIKDIEKYDLLEADKTLIKEINI